MEKYEAPETIEDPVVDEVREPVIGKNSTFLAEFGSEVVKQLKAATGYVVGNEKGYSIDFEPWHTDYTESVDPDHYKFPGGAEVISISQWLTANAAQAVQYICRSSCNDGKNKGDALEDIDKAIRFLTFEKERLK